MKGDARNENKRGFDCAFKCREETFAEFTDGGMVG